MPRPQTARSIQYVTSVWPSRTKLATLPVAGHRPQGNAGRVPRPGQASIERGPVAGVVGSEGRHPDRLRVTHLIEQCVQIGVLDRPERDNGRIHRAAGQRDTVRVTSSVAATVTAVTAMTDGHAPMRFASGCEPPIAAA